MKQLFGSRNGESDDYWISISDLMTGLMVIFLFIALSYMIEIRNDRDVMTEIAVSYRTDHIAIYEALQDEFKEDLPRWKAELDSVNLIVRFKEPEVLFKAGEAELQDRFRSILDDFFPRYVNVLTAPQFRDTVKDVRIEGHTSSEWNSETPLDEAYLLNMWLSQNRVSHVLEYVLRMGWNTERRDWIKKHVVSNGFSSSRLVNANNGSEDRVKSRRVEFRVVTNADDKIRRIVAVAVES
jgi:outer membrane protein OmpA-like peptidoglycan-associated protein